MSDASVSKVPHSRNASARRERRIRFIAQSAEVFAEHGFKDTKMDMLSARLGVAKVILYRHFTSKEDLIHSILDDMAEDLVSLDAVPEESMAIRALETLALVRRKRASFVLLVHHAQNDPLFGRHYSRVHEAISERLASVFLDDSFEPVMSKMSAKAITDLVINGALNWMTYGSEQRDQDYTYWLDQGIKTICGTWRSRFSSLASTE